MSGPSITGWGVATPPGRSQQELWDGYFSAHFGGGRWAAQIFASAGATRRHCAVDPLEEDISSWSTGARMRRWVPEALPLATAAVEGALASSGLDATDVGLLAAVSCTGYATPGVDIHLAEAVGFAPSAQRLLVGHMGCYAALPGLGAVADFVTARRQPAVLVCVELPSLHVQPRAGAGAPDVEQIVAHALFSDAAAAVVVEPGGPGIDVVGVAAATDTSTADHMTWDLTDLGFRMGLSRRVPDVLGRQVGPFVERLLAPHGLTPADVGAWAVHPGGPRILDVVGRALSLPAGALDASRTVLSEHGNCSSTTVLLVLDELRRRGDLTAGRPAVALAFGPGLTIYGSVLRAG